MYNSDLPTRAELPSTKRLLRSTAIAIVTAAVLLVTIVLPAEYAVDPTGLGRVLGLTEMGEIKMALAEEAARDRASDAARTENESAADSAQPAERPAKSGTAPAAGAARTDETTVTLEPGEGTEVKLEMAKGAKVRFEWTTEGGHVNHDTHADGPGGATHSYSKGKAMVRDNGEITAPFGGHHGWFWRNRSEGDVTVTLKTEGDYKAVKRMR
jgi:hypothetical protein